MGYGIIGAFLAIIAIAIFVLAFKLLASSRWLVGFARGVAGLSALSLGLLLSFAAQDLMGYRALQANQTIMTLSFSRTSPKHFTVEIQETSGETATASIEGEQWELNMRMFYWEPLFKAAGFKTGYQLALLKGRYLDLTAQNQSQDSGTDLHPAGHFIDVWAFVNEHGGLVPGINAMVATPGFIPVADGAIFEVVLSGTDLVAKPMNDAAKAAGSSW